MNILRLHYSSNLYSHCTAFHPTFCEDRTSPKKSTPKFPVTYGRLGTSVGRLCSSHTATGHPVRHRRRRFSLANSHHYRRHDVTTLPFTTITLLSLMRLSFFTSTKSITALSLPPPLSRRATTVSSSTPSCTSQQDFEDKWVPFSSAEHGRPDPPSAA